MTAQPKRSFPVSYTLTLAGKVNSMLTEGRSVSRFHIGEPDFPTPEPIAEAGIRAIQEHRTGYTAGAGIPELRDAIAEDLHNRYGVQYGRDSVVVTVGGKFALAATFMALAATGDRVLVPTPCFLSYDPMIRCSGAETIPVPLSLDRGFLPEPDLLEQWVDPRTRILLLNSPHNPTAKVYPEDYINRLTEWLSGNDLLVVSDEVYDRLLFDGRKHVTPAAYEAIRDRVVLVNSFSKTFCMTGWRLGYLAARPEIARAVASIQSHMTSSPNTISQYAALEALQCDPAVIEEMRATFQRRRDLICSLLREIEGVRFIEPEGTFYLFLDISARYGRRVSSSIDASVSLLEDFGVAVVPGSLFGDDRFIRLSFATSDEEIRAGCEAVRRGLDSF